MKVKAWFQRYQEETANEYVCEVCLQFRSAHDPDVCTKDSYVKFKALSINQQAKIASKEWEQNHD
jgi:hypothetical protein